MMNSGARNISTISVNSRLANALPRNSAAGCDGAMRCASSTRFRCSLVHDPFSEVKDANSSETHRIPPTIWRETSEVGSNESEKMTSTRSEEHTSELQS